MNDLLQVSGIRCLFGNKAGCSTTTDKQEHNQISTFHKANKCSWSNEHKEESSWFEIVIYSRWRYPPFAKKVMNLDDNKYINSAAQSIIKWVVKIVNKIPLLKTGARD